MVWAALGGAFWVAMLPPASEPDYGIRWSAPSECPAGEAVTTGARDLLLYAEGRDARPEVRVEGTVIGTPTEGYRLHLVVQTGDARDEWDVEGRDCSVLKDTAALLLAMTLDPVATARVVEEDQSMAAAFRDRLAVEEEAPLRPAGQREESAAQVPAVPEPQMTVVDALPEPIADVTAPAAPQLGLRKEMQRPPISRPRARVALSGVGAYGGPPGLAGGIAAALGASWKRARLTAGVLYLTPRTARYAEPLSDVGVSIQQVAGFVRGCGSPGFERVVFPLCAQIEVGALRSRGFGFERNANRRTTWAAGAAGAGIEVGVNRLLALHVGAEAVVPFVRVSYASPGLPDLYRAPPVGVRFGGGLAMRFP